MGIFDGFKQKKPEERSPEGKPETPRGGEQHDKPRWQVGDRIDNRYEIYRILGGPGKSGMGIVYACIDHEDGEPIALKTFQDRFLQDRTVVDRFKQEAEVWISLDKHFNIVQANWFSEIDGRPFISLEYVAGHELYGVDLFGWINRGRLPAPLTINFAIQFCHGMMHAEMKFKEHGRNFVHQDIKPSNILVTQDKVVKITDFGLARTFAELNARSTPVCRTRLHCGTPPYMSPEQCRGDKDIDVRSDIYSFGCVLYEMVSGKPPFVAPAPEGVFYHHLRDEPKLLATDSGLQLVIMKCLKKSPDSRYQNFGELEEDLSAIYYRMTKGVVKTPSAAELTDLEICNRGLSFHRLGLDSEALECYFRVLKTNPNSEIAHFNLGLSYKALDRFDESIKEFYRVLEINPHAEWAHSCLGDIYRIQGDLAEAERQYKLGLIVHPDKADLYSELAVFYFEQGRMAEAIREFQQALKINPTDALDHSLLGSAYEALERMDEAIAEYLEALKIDPKEADTHTSLGLAYEKQGKLDKAVIEYHETLKISPEHGGGHYALASVLEKIGRNTDALFEWNICLTLPIDTPLWKEMILEARQHIRDLERKLR